LGVSPTFNIADLKPYLREEDDLESRTTQMQEGEMMRTFPPVIHPRHRHHHYLNTIQFLSLVLLLVLVLAN
jgi:hypothetical protein